MNHANLNSAVTKLVNSMAKQSEAILMDKLNDLVKRNLLVIESTQPVFVKDEYSQTIKVQQAVRLVLKDMEYIKQLETENQQLKEQLQNIKEALGKVIE